MLLENEQKEAWCSFITAHARILKRLNRELEENEALSFEWYDILLALEEAPEQRLRMGELLNVVLVSPSGLTRLVDRIEKAGYLQRESCNTDRRVVYAALTEAGRRAREASWPIYAAQIQKYFGRHLNHEEATWLTQLLQRMYTCAEAR